MSCHCPQYSCWTCRYRHIVHLLHIRLPAHAKGLERSLAVLQVLEASAPTAPGARLFSQLAAEPSETQQLQSPAPLRPPGNWGLAAAVRPPAADQGELAAWLGRGPAHSSRQDSMMPWSLPVSKLSSHSGCMKCACAANQPTALLPAVQVQFL